MSATRCSCIFDSHLHRMVQDPTCPAASVHEMDREPERETAG